MGSRDRPDASTGSPAEPYPAQELRELERLAIDLAVGAGAIVREQRPERLTIDTKSSSSDVVTEMDGRAEAHVREHLAHARPRDAVFGEETGRGPDPDPGLGTDGGAGGMGRSQGSEGAEPPQVTWVVDPIDGTVNYLYGIGEYAVSVAAVLGDPTQTGRWRPLAGAVAHPEAGLVYSAARGQGSSVRRIGAVGQTAEPAPLTPSTADSLELTLLGTGFAYVAHERERQARELVEILPRVRDIRRGGSAALDLCAVAAGRLDAYYERGINAWDIAAGWLIVTEAGGIVSGVGGDAPTEAGLVAAAPGVQPALRELVERVTLTDRGTGSTRPDSA